MSEPDGSDRREARHPRRRSSGLRITAVVFGLVGWLLSATVGLPYAYLVILISGSGEPSAPLAISAGLAIASASVGLLGWATAIWKPRMAAAFLSVAGVAMLGYAATWAQGTEIGLVNGIVTAAIVAAFLLLIAAWVSYEARG